MTKPPPPGRAQSSESPTADLIRRAYGHAAALRIDRYEADPIGVLLMDLASALEAADAKLAALPACPEPRVAWGIERFTGTVARRRNEAEARESAEPGDVVMRRLVYPPYRTEWVPADV